MRYWGLLLGICCTPVGVSAQRSARATESPAVHPSAVESVSVVAGARKRASGFHKWLFGREYRDLWTTPITVPVLDLRTFAGGLRPYREGGGKQTKSLRFKAGNGREYVFRSVRKNPAKALPPRLRHSILAAVVEDQMHSAHPAGPLVADCLLDAAGVLHPHPLLLAMPDDPRLGEYRQDYAGRLGLLEQYPEEGPGDTPGFGGATKVVGSDELLRRINRSPDDLVDARAYVTARLVDLLLNDWDRHPGQWRWARRPPQREARWLPVPRDRDQVFASFDGILPGLVRLTLPKFVSFNEDYSLGGLTVNSRQLDRRLLASVDRPTWDSIATWLQARFSDATIDSAVHRMPPEYQPLSAPRLSAILKGRREGLAASAERFYRSLAQAVDIHASDAPDRAEVTRLDDRSVRVQLYDGRKAEAGAPYLDRVFEREDTEEIRVYLHDGDDRAVVRGASASGPKVRIIGGNGDNRLVDSSTVDRKTRQTRLYDVGPTHGVHYGPDTLFDRRPWHRLGIAKLRPPVPDHGQGLKPGLRIAYNEDFGLQTGLGVSFYRYGFRKWPYARLVSLSLGYATRPGRLNATLKTDFRREASPFGLTATVQAREFGVVRFHGLGNETPTGPDDSYFRAVQRQYILEPAVDLLLSTGGRIGFGPVVKYAKVDSIPNRLISAARPYGFPRFAQAGLRLTVTVDPRQLEDSTSPRHRLTAGATLYPALLDVDRTFGEAHTEAVAYLDVPVPLRPVLALRAGAKKVWGGFPFHEAAFLGGAGTIRGFSEQRFAGDASLYGGAEIRVRLTGFSVLLPGDLGVLGMGDIGRVFLAGESSDRWHTAVGGGIWLALIDPANTLTVTLAHSSEENRLYITFGFLF